MKRTEQGGTIDAVSHMGLNEVMVCGRVSGTVEQRELPSGDTVVQLRLGCAETAGTHPRRIDLDSRHS